MLIYTHPYPKSDVFWEIVNRHRSSSILYSIYSSQKTNISFIFRSIFTTKSILIKPNLINRIMSNKEEEVQRAKLAEQAERYKLNIEYFSLL